MSNLIHDEQTEELIWEAPEITPILIEKLTEAGGGFGGDAFCMAGCS